MFKRIFAFFSPKPKWKQLWDQRGSNPGGVYLDPEGDKWYVKFPEDPERINNEICAAKLYQLAGIKVPEYRKVTIGGKPGVASRWLEGTRVDPLGLVVASETVQGFGMDCWLANWDVVGLDYDNMVLDPYGDAWRLDPGGAMVYRAMGAPKGYHWGPYVSELETFKDPKTHPQSHKVFCGAYGEPLKRSIQVVLDLNPEAIRAIVDEYGPGDREALYTTLMARRNHMKEVYEVLCQTPQASCP